MNADVGSSELDQDRRLTAAAASRNKTVILEALSEVLSSTARVLEVASGTGEHAVFFAGARPGWTWCPSDLNPERLASIRAWRQHAGHPNVEEPRRLDVTESGWEDTPCDAVVAVNLTHIAPWGVTEALIRGAATALAPGGVLFLYGPFRVDGQAKPASNRAFDEHLRLQDEAWGLRDVEVIEAFAARQGFLAEARVAMPSHNLSLVLRRGA